MNTTTSPLADVTGIDEAAVRRAPQVHSVYVYEAPVRLWHWINALAIVVLAVGLVGRAYGALVGNHHARELFTLPATRAAYWKEVRAMLAWYLFLRPRPNQYASHNPMARLAVFFGYFLLTLFMIATGFALYGEGTQAGSWAHTAFTSWVIPLFGGSSQTVHTWHHLDMWAMVCFVILHIYAAIREDIMGRQSMVSTMISGHRTFKD